MTVTSSKLPQPVKVVRIIARLNIGGPAIHVALLTAGLNDAQFQSILVAGQIGPEEGDMAYFARELGIEPVVIPELGREISVFGDLKTLWALIRLIRNERPQIVHTHTAKAGFVGRLAAWLSGVPVIVHTFHGHVFHGYFGPRTTQVFIWMEQLVGRMTTIVLTLSEKLRSDLITLRIAPPAKIRIVPLLLNLSEIASVKHSDGALRSELGLSTDALLIGIVGRLVPIKNHYLFLEAAERVLAAKPQVSFVIVGDGECRADLEQYVGAHGLADRVKFLGWRRDLPNVYSSLNVVALTSNNEGTPVSLIEAMAAAVPVVSTAVGGVPDLLGGGERGILVQAGDVSGLAAALLKALDRPDSERIKRAKAWVLAEHGAERNIERIRQLYLELLKTKRLG